MTRRKPPVDPKLKDFSRENRRDATFPARLLWSRLRRGQIGGLRFRREHVIGGHIADFACIESKLVVELDGTTHTGTGEIDDRRTANIASQGYRVMRVTNDEVLADLDGVVERISRAVGLDV